MTIDRPPLPDWHLYPDDPGSGSYSGGYALPGKIQIFDTRLNRYIPLNGVKVTAKVSMFTTYEGFTDDLGDYYLDGSVTGTADYAIKFQRAGFAIRSNKHSNAYISRVNQPDHWNYGIEGGMDKMWGHMFRGAFWYYYGDVAELRRPNNPILNLPQILIGTNATGDNSGSTSVTHPTTKLWRKYINSMGAEVEYGSDEIFSTSVHELAHVAHKYTMNGVGQYAQVDGNIKESWATAVEWLITGMEYRDQGIGNYGDWNYYPNNPPIAPNSLAYQFWGTLGYQDQEYTSLFINLILL